MSDPFTNDGYNRFKKDSYRSQFDDGSHLIPHYLLSEAKKEISRLKKQVAALEQDKEGLNKVLINVYGQLENMIAECQRLNIVARDAYGS